MTPRKLPRVTLEKARSSSPADRRKAVAELGDALRELGAVRVLVPDDLPFGTERAREVGVQLLSLLDDYFGLERRPLASAVSKQPGGSSRAAEHTVLLELHLVEKAPEVELERGSERIRVSARPGEWIAVAGPALEVLTGGVVEHARARAATSGASTAVDLTARPDWISHTLPEFLDA